MRGGEPQGRREDRTERDFSRGVSRSPGGDIAAVYGGPGLTGGGTEGVVTLNADFDGSGYADRVARSDHNHAGVYAPANHAHSDLYYDRSVIDALINQVNALEARVDELQMLLDGVVRNGDNIVFSGVNVQVVNGTGTTEDTACTIGMGGYCHPSQRGPS